jgi:glutamate racemase
MLGIFDSGFGGITVLRAVRALLPDIDVVYFGDSARAPYGNRTRDVITSFTKECCKLLFDRGCVLVVLACNSASSGTLRTLQQEWLPAARGNHKSQVPNPKNILGVIYPLAEEAVRVAGDGAIAVVGTRSTVASGAYPEVLEKLRPGVRVLQKACPLLVPLVEEGRALKPETRRVMKIYLRELKAANPSVLILGCTHFAPLRGDAERMMGRRCTVLDSPSIVARGLRDYLKRHPEYSERIPRNGRTTFLTTGDAERFAEMGSVFLGRRIEGVEEVDLEMSSLTSFMPASRSF